MRVLVAYDVSTVDQAGRKRLRDIAQACEDYGQRVQYSLFECVLSPVDWVRLRAHLLDLFKVDEDSLRFYPLEEDAYRRVEHHGVRKPRDLTGPLVV